MILNTLPIYLVSMETPPTHLKSSQPQNRFKQDAIQDKHFKFSLSFQLLVTLRHDGPKSDIWHRNASWKVINHCTVHSSFIIQNKILCQFHLFMADHSYQIEILHLMWSARSQILSTTWSFSWDSWRSKSLCYQHSLIWKHSQRTDIHTLANRILYVFNRFIFSAGLSRGSVPCVMELPVSMETEDSESPAARSAAFFWLRQELKESLCPSVCPGQSALMHWIFIFLS